MLNGIYQCEATNGILNLDGYLVNSGKKTVQFVGEYRVKVIKWVFLNYFVCIFNVCIELYFMNILKNED